MLRFKSYFNGRRQNSFIKHFTDMCHQNYSWDYGYSVATDDDDDDNNNNNSDYFFSTLKNKSAISSKTRIKIIKSQKVIIFESTRVTLSYLTHYLLQKKKT